jgi:hypothetical protein
MRWVNDVRVLSLAAALLAGGCGNYSTEDIRFLSALPHREDLHVAVPAGGTAPAGALATRAAVTSATCPSLPGDATVWQWAKPTSDGLNAGVDWVVGLIDVIRRYPPTRREEDWRRWGPFDDEKHPRLEIQVTMTRSWPSGLAGVPRYAYAFEARVKAGGSWTPIVEGYFDGASSASGGGQVDLRFDNIRLLQMDDSDSPDGIMSIQYDRASDPRTTQLSLGTGGFGVVQFDYGYSGYADGRGAFDYAFRNAAGDLLEVATSYDAAGAGRLRVQFTAAAGGTGFFNQCWNAAGCLVYVDDPFNFTESCGPGPGPCLTGDVAACVAVPVAPF